MSRIADEVYDGTRCAVCELPFEAGDIGVGVPDRAERMHRDAPDGCPAAEEQRKAPESGSAPGAVMTAYYGEGRAVLRRPEARGSVLAPVTRAASRVTGPSWNRIAKGRNSPRIPPSAQVTNDVSLSVGSSPGRRGSPA